MKGRIFAIGVVCLFNILRYFYYHRYLGLPFRLNFFVLTSIFLVIAWWGGQQFDRAKYYSEKDPLTNVYNRRRVERSFQKFALTCKKKNEKLGVIILDLDNFKAVNDTYGHQKGDEWLKDVSFILKRLANKKDFIARWGGDEFLILVPNPTKDFELHYIQAVKKELETSGDLLQIAKLSASIGFAIYPSNGENFVELIQYADGRMYKMKDNK